MHTSSKLYMNHQMSISESDMWTFITTLKMIQYQWLSLLLKTGKNVIIAEFLFCTLLFSMPPLVNSQIPF